MPLKIMQTILDWHYFLVHNGMKNRGCKQNHSQKFDANPFVVAAQIVVQNKMRTVLQLRSQ